MGSKYTTVAVSGYNSSPPSDDGSQTAANQVKWSTHKDKLGDPLKTAVEAINTALVTFTNFSSRSVTASDSTLATDHMKTIEIASTTSSGKTISLMDAATAAAGYIVSVKNLSPYIQTMGRVTTADTIDGVAANRRILPNEFIAFKVNASANGYYTLNNNKQVISVTDHGAVGDGSTDDTTAIQAAIDANPGQSIFFPKGSYVISNITINEPVVLYGESVSENPASGNTLAGTRLLAKSGSTGSMITVDRGSTYKSYNEHLPGVGFRSLHIDGNDRGVDVAAFDISWVDHLVMEDVYIEDVKYQAILCNTSVRESWFNRVQTRFCGSVADSKPCLDLRETSTADAHNMLSFNDCLFIFSLGHTVQIDNFDTSTTKPRDISFNNCFTHGVVSAQDTFPYTFTDAQKKLKHMIIGDVGRIFSNNSKWLLAGNEVETIEITSDATTSDAIISFAGGMIASHYGSASNFHGVTVAGGVFFSSGVYYTGHNTPISQSGGTVIVPPASNYFSGNTTNPVITTGMTIQGFKDSDVSSYIIQTPNGSNAMATRMSVGSGANPEIRLTPPMKLGTAGTASNYSVGAIAMDSTTKNPIMVSDDTGANLNRQILMFRGTQTTVGAAGGASALPATPTGYIKFKDLAGNNYAIPYYAQS
jgi:hypothetical protein